mgnify:FL=1
MKRLFRDSFNGILGGVCSGLGEYFEIDPVIFRLLFIVFFFMFGGGVFIYLIAWLIIPDRY